jgi:hypothetical protein
MLPGRSAAILDETGTDGAGSRAVQPTGKDYVAVAAGDQPGPKTVNRREVFMFAAVLAATALTGAAAIAGLKRSVPAVPSTPQIGQTITPKAPAPPQRVEPGG